MKDLMKDFEEQFKKIPKGNLGELPKEIKPVDLALVKLINNSKGNDHVKNS